jgi:hypothetical protein
MAILTQYSIACQVPGAEPYTICPYSGEDLSQVLGINQVNLPEGHYGWILECGEVLVNAGGQTQAAFDPYQVLGLDQSASDEEVKKRYRELLFKLHPDRMLKGLHSCYRWFCQPTR